MSLFQGKEKHATQSVCRTKPMAYDEHRGWEGRPDDARGVIFQHDCSEVLVTLPLANTGPYLHLHLPQTRWQRSQQNRRGDLLSRFT